MHIYLGLIKKKSLLNKSDPQIAFSSYHFSPLGTCCSIATTNYFQHKGSKFEMYFDGN